jgi:hypothetical protein
LYDLRELFYISPPSRPGMPPRSRPVLYIPKKNKKIYHQERKRKTKKVRK